MSKLTELVIAHNKRAIHTAEFEKGIKDLMLEIIGKDEFIEITDPDNMAYGLTAPSQLNEFRAELRQKVEEL